MRRTRNFIIWCWMLSLAGSGSFLFNPPSVAAQQKNAQKGAQPKTAAAMKQDPNEVDTVQNEMRPYIDRFVTERGSLNRFYTAELSPTRRDKMQKFLADWLGALTKLDFEGMSEDGQIDFILFKNYVEHEIRQMDLQQKASAETAVFRPFSQTITDLEDNRRKMQPIDPAKTAVVLNDLNKQVAKVRQDIENELRAAGRGNADSGKYKKTVANRAIAEINGLRNNLRTWFTYYNGYDPMFSWWMDSPYRELDKSLQDYTTYLNQRLVGIRADNTIAGANAPGGGIGTGRGGNGGGQPGGGNGAGRNGGGGNGNGGGNGAAQAPARPATSDDDSDIIGNPIGREGLMSELQFEMVPYTPEELIAIANKEFAWCENEMKKASRELGYGDDWKKALEYVKTKYVEPGKQPELIKRLADEAEKFIDDHDLVTVPKSAREDWHMEMMSPERQLVNPFFLGGEFIQVSYPTDTMTQDQKMMSMRGNNPHFSHATVFHELIPGHHLQGWYNSRFKTERGIFSTPFSVEGWALYWEMLLYDMGFDKSPEDRVGALFWRMHRCARIIFSLSFHMEKMTPKECIDFLVDRVGHERDNAAAEVRRSFNGSYGPLYQAGYLLGGMQIYALHKELVDSGKMTNRQFHDAILRENRIPNEMIRAALMKQKLTRDFRTTWKFYGPNPGQ